MHPLSVTIGEFPHGKGGTDRQSRYLNNLEGKYRQFRWCNDDVGNKIR